jgi:quercetin dioxygenase-like cupin family protein
MKVEFEDMARTLQRSDDGERIELGPNDVVIRISGDETDGAFSLCEYTAPPDGPSPPLHIHEETAEVIYVLDGTLECTVEDDTFTAEAGATVTIPRETVHTFSVTGNETARFLLLYSPAGFEGYFEEMGEYLQSLPPGPPDMDKVAEKSAELSEVYDQTIPDPESQ